MLDFDTLDGGICLADITSTHTIIKNKKYFSGLKIKDYASSISPIFGSAKIIMGSGRVSFSMKRSTKFELSDALHSLESHRILLSFKNTLRNGYHIDTMSIDCI